MPGVRLISADEYVVVRTRTHAKALIWPSIALIGLGGLVGSGAAAVPSGYRPAGQVVVVSLGLLVVIWLIVRPFLRWLSTTYVITTHRLITRRGIVHRVAKALPLTRVNDVSYGQGLADRLFGCGTLHVRTAGDIGMIALVDVPDVRRVHQVLGELVIGHESLEPTESGWM